MLNWQNWYQITGGQFPMLRLFFLYVTWVVIFICAQPILLPTFHFLMVFGMMFPTTNEENLSAEAVTWL